MLTNLDTGTRNRVPTLVDPRCELIPHNCDNGHEWIAIMYPPPRKANASKWRYVNSQQQRCPHCGSPQSDEEIIR